MANGYQYQSAKALVITLTILFGVMLVLALILGACLLSATVEMRKNMNAGPQMPNAAVLFTQAGAGILWGLFYLITGIVFLVWISRANANAHALGANDMSITPGWSAGWFFVPFANLVKPYQNVREIWNASDSDPRDISASGSAPLIVSAWWTLWILSNICGNASFRATWSAKTPKEHLFANYLNLADDILSVGALILVVGVVHGIHERQERLFGSLRKSRKKQAAAATPEPYQAAW
jgi:uncharacterized protein DUF4328